MRVACRLLLVVSELSFVLLCVVVVRWFEVCCVPFLFDVFDVCRFCLFVVCCVRFVVGCLTFDCWLLRAVCCSCCYLSFAVC